MQSNLSSWLEFTNDVACRKAAKGRIWFLFTLASMATLGCGARVEDIDTANSQTHWLEGCTSSAECAGGLECLCGVCTSRCTSNTQCTNLDNDAVCGSGGDRCEALTSNPVCVLSCTEDDDCPFDNSCENGSCTVAKEPAGARPAGAPCDVAQDCASGLCEGEGCEPFGGVCVDGPMRCTRGGPSTYCGCDGVTFEASGMCNGLRYAHFGSCEGSITLDDAGTPVAPTSLANGELCTNDDECASGKCYTETCFAEDSRCVDSTQGACLDNIVSFCGCDGVTFQGSSGGYGCAPAPYAFIGACNNGTQQDGERCDVDEDCVSGICEGEGCGAFEGVCVAANRTCTDDLITYCNCAGEIVNGSSSCPNTRYQELEACGVTPTEEECASLSEATCAGSCSPIYGYKPDGSTQFVACAVYPHGTFEAWVCAESQSGERLNVPSPYVPEGWTTLPEADCQSECFSPFRNTELASSSESVGCECTTVGSACIDGVGMACLDGTDDLDPTRVWNVWPDACDVDLDTCQNGYQLQECVNLFERCIENGVVLDKGTPVYCGAPPIPCGQRDESGCSGECTPLWGTAVDGSRAYAGCLALEEVCNNEDPANYCIQRHTPQTIVGVGDPVLVATCTVPSGWTQLEPQYCDAAISDVGCLGLSEEACQAPCGVRMGRRSPDGEGEFIGCDYDDCINARVVCAQNDDGEVVEFFGCVLSGWSQVDPSACEG